MGRPINFKKRGGSESGKIRFQAHFTGELAAENAWLNRQIGSNSYELVAESDSELVQIFELTDTIAEGLATLTIQPAPSRIFFEIASIISVAQDTAVTTLAEGTHTVTVVGGNPIVAATVEIEIDAAGDIIASSVVTEGEYATDLTGETFTLQGVDGGATLTANFTMGDMPATELVRKLTQHRAVTYDGNAYKTVDEITEPTTQGVLSKIS